ncbi:MAG: hypothetical protein JNM63_08100, partial [Spirochaetia bacterium]|nr:hypothetical protein [Spirochaetia bacterium]
MISGVAVLILASWGWGQLAVVEPAGKARNESRIDFNLDADFLAKGGVQVFFELIHRDQPAESRESFKKLRPLDKEDLWSRKSEPLYVLASRLVFEVDKDIRFFSAERVLDEYYMNRLLPSYRVS